MQRSLSDALVVGRAPANGAGPLSRSRRSQVILGGPLIRRSSGEATVIHVIHGVKLDRRGMPSVEVPILVSSFRFRARVRVRVRCAHPKPPARLRRAAAVRANPTPKIRRAAAVRANANARIRLLRAPGGARRAARRKSATGGGSTGEKARVPFFFRKKIRGVRRRRWRWRSGEMFWLA